VQVLDLSGISNHREVLSTYLSHNNPPAVGITATTPQLPLALEIARSVRTLAPNTKIILGGPHVTLIAAAANKHVARAEEALRSLQQQVDVLVSGDDEHGVIEALSLEEGLVDNDRIRSQKHIGGKQWPARELIELASYRYTIDDVPATSIITQLGCPFGCRFCGGRGSPTFRQIKTRTVEDVVAELEFLRETYGYKGFMFYDDELNLSKTNLLQLLAALRTSQEKRQEQWRFRGFIRADLFDQEEAVAMKDAGFEWLLVGIESGSMQMLTNMGKGTTPEKNLQCVEIAHQAGLKVKALMSLGHPGESSISTEGTARWLRRAQVDDLDVSIITVYPGTPYYNDAVFDKRLNAWTYTAPETGDRLHSLAVNFEETADYYKGDPSGGYRSFVFTDFWKPEDLVNGRDWLEQTIRQELGLPAYPRSPATMFEHSMGMGSLPATILRSTLRST
jgi:radical SAM superfamily enzyme YgiQ (UPF0313 family)